MVKVNHPTLLLWGTAVCLVGRSGSEGGLLGGVLAWTTIDPLPGSAASRRRVSTQHRLPLFSSTTDKPAEDATTISTAATVPSFVMQAFTTECDNVNYPPSLSILLRNLRQLSTAGSDIRGTFVNHARQGHLALVASEIAKTHQTAPPLTPLAAYCFGYAFAQMIAEQQASQDSLTIVIGIDPRIHSMRLADALARGAAQAGGVEVVYTGLATTPACSWFCASQKCDAAIMITASHLPQDKNGLKFFSKQSGGLTADQIVDLGRRAESFLTQHLFREFQIPPTSGDQAVMCSQWVDWMPQYRKQLQQCILEQTGSKDETPLQGLTIVLNSGNGSGGFFAQVLEELGADLVGLNLDPDGTFPNSVPNPEYKQMMDETTASCIDNNADLGIMLDTDADRCGFIVANANGDYEALNRNRLIALLAVIFAKSSPGCTFVTDSVTSEGLSSFIQSLGLEHVRYVKGYANVIGKAKELTDQQGINAEVAIETSGHCAMKENNYLDDGTYTAVKVVSLLAREKCNLLELIEDMDELDEISELRMTVKGGSLGTMRETFDFCALKVEEWANREANWEVDRENLEGIRIRGKNNQFFMLRKSLHDPIISLQIEAQSLEDARQQIVTPLRELFQLEPTIKDKLGLDVLVQY